MVPVVLSAVAAALHKTGGQAPTNHARAMRCQKRHHIAVFHGAVRSGAGRQAVCQACIANVLHPPMAHRT